MGRELPTHPTLFAKLARSLADPYADLAIPQASTSVDYEGELVIVIGRGGRDIASESALDHIGGYTLMNDVSMRDWQYRTLQWFAGKNFERSTPVGPWVVTPDELSADAELVTTVNGDVRQRSPITDLVFDARALIADISSMTALEPGDLIATGTPGGVGLFSGKLLTPGQRVRVEIEGVGTIENPVVAED
jgi:acylpyruvate hydrolase